MSGKKFIFIEYIKHYKFNSLFLKNLILITMAIYLPLIAICFAVYLYFSNIYMKEITTSEQNNLLRIQELSDTVFQNAIQTGIKLCEEQKILSFLNYDIYEWKDYSVVQEVDEMRKILSISSSKYINSIYVYGEKSDYLLTANGLNKRKSIVDSSWYPMYQEEKGSVGVRKWFRLIEEFNAKDLQVGFTAGFYLPYNEKTEKTGMLLVNMDYNWLNDFLESGDTVGQELLILDENQKIMYTKDYRNFGQKVGDRYQKDNLIDWDGMSGITADGNHMVSIRKSQLGSWEYVYITPMVYYNDKIMILRVVITLASFLLFLLSIIVSFAVSVKVFLPVKSIIQMLENPERYYNLQMDANSSNEQRNELIEIMGSLKEMISGREKDRESLMEAVTNLKKTEVSLLQAQINPHFLFNTLQTVNFMAIGLSGTDNQVSDAIGSLSVMLRELMRVNVPQGLLKDEVDYCKAYIELEQFRYGDRLQVIWNIEDKLEEYQVVRMMLQPLLENSIIHGFKNLKYGGKITVDAKEVNNRLILYVKDNGVGQTETWIRNMNKKLKESQSILGSHIGIANVNQRIRLIYGNEYGIQVEENSQNFTVRIELPVINPKK